MNTDTEQSISPRGPDFFLQARRVVIAGLAVGPSESASIRVHRWLSPVLVRMPF